MVIVLLWTVIFYVMLWNLTYMYAPSDDMNKDRLVQQFADEDEDDSDDDEENGEDEDNFNNMDLMKMMQMMGGLGNMGGGIPSTDTNSDNKDKCTDDTCEINDSNQEECNQD